jgi:hypothetical protein
MARLGLSSGIATYSIGGRELLLCGDDGAAALGSVERGLALYNSLARSTSGAASSATDLGNGVPVFRHICGGVWTVEELSVCSWWGAGG